MKIALFAALMLVLSLCEVTEAQNKTALQQDDHFKPNYSPSAWTREVITGNDRELIVIRKNLESANPIQLSTIIRSEKSKKVNPQLSPSKLFELGTSAYLLVHKFRKSEYKNDLNSLMHMMNKSQSPKTYSYTRLRFLLAAQDSVSGNKELVNLGSRLARYDKKDYDVRYYTAKLLQPGVKPAEKQLGLQLCREMALIDDKRPSLEAMRGSIYFRSWLETKNSVDKREATASYKKYIQIAPKDDPFIGQAKAIIKLMGRTK